MLARQRPDLVGRALTGPQINALGLRPVVERAVAEVRAITGVHHDVNVKQAAFMEAYTSSVGANAFTAEAITFYGRGLRWGSSSKH